MKIATVGLDIAKAGSAHCDRKNLFAREVSAMYTIRVRPLRGSGLGCRTPCGFCKGAAFSPVRNKLKRYYGMGHLHFLTFSCHRRKPLLGTVRARNQFVRILGEVRARFGFLLVGDVVMPDHVHLLVSEPRKGTPSTVLQVLKQRVSRALRGKRRRVAAGQLRLRFAEPGDELPRFWQRRFYDFNVWSRAKRREKLNYRHENPVKRKLVEHPKDWPWSSWSFYAGHETGMVKIDAVD